MTISNCCGNVNFSILLHVVFKNLAEKPYQRVVRIRSENSCEKTSLGQSPCRFMLLACIGELFIDNFPVICACGWWMGSYKALSMHHMNIRMPQSESTHQEGNPPAQLHGGSFDGTFVKLDQAITKVDDVDRLNALGRILWVSLSSRRHQLSRRFNCCKHKQNTELTSPFMSCRPSLNFLRSLLAIAWYLFSQFFISLVNPQAGFASRAA